MKKTIQLLIPVLIILTGCGGRTSQENSGDLHSHAHQHESGHPGEASDDHSGHGHNTEDEVIHIPPDKQKQWNIQTSPAEMRDLQPKIHLPGVVTLNRNRTADISSYVEGKVNRVATDLGKRIRKGDTLAVINSPEFAKSQADFLEARFAYLLSRREYERSKMLLEEKAIEKREYDRREAAYQKASTQYGALGSALHSYGIDHQDIEELIEKCEALESQPYKCDIADPFLSIVSPVPGTVVFRDIIIGEHIKSEKTIFTVSDLSRIWVLLDAYEKDLPSLRIHSDVEILTSVYGDEIFQGRITNISDVIDEKIRTVTVRAEVDNREHRLKPNMYVQGRIQSPAVRKRLAVPDSAVQNLQDEKIVFIQTAPGDFMIRHVEIQEQINGWTVIRAGLQPGEVFVHEGAFTLKSELTKGTFGHAHAH
ncbi:MAG: efflux RND transporter periplasmic adaptor subunit [Candidatus Aminicenantaceae bacterium]